MKRLFLLLLCLIALAACSSQPAAPAPKAGQEGGEAPKKTLGQVLVEKNKQLENQNQELTKRLKELEDQRQEDQAAHEERLQNMDRTIRLMEMNLKTMQEELAKKPTSPPPAPPATPAPRLESKPEPKPEQEPEEESAPASASAKGSGPTLSPSSLVPRNPKTGLPLQEFETPSNSKAIEEVSLLPEGSGKKSGSAKKPAIADLKDQAKAGNAFPLVPVPAPAASEEEEDQDWEDPDLEEPTNPMILQVLPGAKKLYQTSFKLFSQGKYEESMQSFGDFIQRYPNDQDADNSQFWIAQARYNLGQYDLAEEEIRKVLKKYPHGDTRKGYKTPDAILLLARIKVAQKKPIRARYYLNYLIKHYSDNRSAEKAQLELKALNSF